MTDSKECTHIACVRARALAKADHGPWPVFREYFEEHMKSDVKQSCFNNGIDGIPGETESFIHGFNTVFRMLNASCPADPAVLPTKEEVPAHAADVEEDKKGKYSWTDMVKTIEEDTKWLVSHWGECGKTHIDPKRELFKVIFPYIAGSSWLKYANELRCKTLWSSLINKEFIRKRIAATKTLTYHRDSTLASTILRLALSAN